MVEQRHNSTSLVSPLVVLNLAESETDRGATFPLVHLHPRPLTGLTRWQPRARG